MAFSVSSLTDYVNQNSQDLLTAMQFQGETAAIINRQVGIKSAAALQLLAATAFPQDGAACGFNASGTTTFSQRTLTASPIKWQDTLCPRTLEAKWTQMLLSAGQNYNESDIPRMVITEIVKYVTSRLEITDWQGDTTSGDGTLNRYDGLLKIIMAATGTATATASTWSEANSRAIVRSIISKVPAALKGNTEVKIFMGYDKFDDLCNKISIDNHFHMFDVSTYGTLRAENSPYTVKAVHGLDGVTGSGNTSIIAALPSNLFIGLDMMGEEDNVKMWYSEDDDNVKYSIRHRRGTQVAYPSEIVEYANS